MGEAKWRGEEREWKVWQTQPFPEDDLLEHVRRYLNSPEGTPPTARLWRITHDALSSPKGGLGSQADWELLLPSKRSIPFRWDTIQLMLFRVGVGLLSLSVRPPSQDLNEWLDFIHFFRFTKREQVRLRAQRRVGIDPETKEPKFEPFFPEPAGGVERHRDGVGYLDEIVTVLLATAKIEHENGRWWEEVFIPKQLLPYAILFVDEFPENDISLLLYRLRNFFHSQQPLHPADEDLRLDHPSLLPYAKGQWFVFSLDGGAFVAVNAPQTEFFRTTLPDHLRQQYFLLFLLTLHQRFALMGLSREVSEHWLRGGEKERTAIFERIRDRLLEFTARGYFTQVMQREHHHRVYRKWQEVFQLERLYQEVSEEVREMHEYLQARQVHKLERRINALSAFIGIPALVFGFLSINLHGITAKEEGLSLGVALGFAVLGFLLGFLVWLWLSRR
ncbi:MAG: hypothetical protein SLRJCFUN_001340 [Candidatus Fervidibacter sp.]